MPKNRAKEKLSKGEIDLSYRPTNYWSGEGILQLILGPIREEHRRQRIVASLQTGDGELPDGFLAPEFSSDLQQALERVHPSFMGGAYLPEIRKGDVEIARIALQSTTGDVISLRARQCPQGGIEYNLVDEYDTKFDILIKHSEMPLSLNDVFDIFNKTPYGENGEGTLLTGALAMQLEDVEPEEVRHFVSVSSTFYPNLSEFCDNHIENFLGLGRKSIRELAISAFNPLNHENEDALETLFRYAISGNRYSINALTDSLRVLKNEYQLEEVILIFSAIKHIDKNTLKVIYKLFYNSSENIQYAILFVFLSRRVCSPYISECLQAVILDPNLDLDVRKMASAVLGKLTGVVELMDAFSFLRTRAFPKRIPRGIRLESPDSVSSTQGQKRQGDAILTRLREEFPLGWGQLINYTDPMESMDPPVQRWAQKHLHREATDLKRKRDEEDRRIAEALRLAKEIEAVTSVQGWTAPWVEAPSMAFKELTEVEKGLLLKWLEHRGVREVHYCRLPPIGMPGIAWVSLAGNKSIRIENSILVLDICSKILATTLSEPL